jgi:hypothetical protein
MFTPIGGGIPRRTLCCRTRCGSHFHSYGFAPWLPQSFLSSRTRGASVGGQRCQCELGPSPAYRRCASCTGSKAWCLNLDPVLLRAVTSLAQRSLRERNYELGDRVMSGSTQAIKSIVFIAVLSPLGSGTSNHAQQTTGQLLISSGFGSPPPHPRQWNV